MYFKLASFTLALWIIFGASIASDFEGCRVGFQNRTSHLFKTKLADYEHNEAKKDEVIRVKAFFKGKDPAFYFQRNNTNGIAFGIFNGMLATYRNFEDYHGNMNPCSINPMEDAFPEDKFTEVDFIVTQKGFFSVIIHSPQTIVLSCDTKQVFDKEMEYFLEYDYYGKKEHLFYDCEF
ncbi:hypothetical protein ACFFRR_003703 [Megaselia abdita]